ncbi:MAG: DUF1553 domain-containing protein, partial [Planctomycetaceae bacterium]
IAGLEMPEGGEPVDDATIAAVAEWIAAGAPDPRESLPDPLALLAARRSLWSLAPLADPGPPPAVTRPDWAADPIDRLLLARLEGAGLEPAGEADAATLLRRLSYVLTGLPPTPAEVDAFLADRSPGALERVVDRLLASPRYGERMARHWMDLVRYAESHGSQGDPDLANAWRYRDHLVRAFNDDVPYDRFVREQIAGDLLPDPRWHPDGFNDSAIGPAHLCMVEHGYQPVDALDDLVKATENRIDVVSKTFLGLTVACARCHDHKFEAVTQEDYYALHGVFASPRPGQVFIDDPGRTAVATAELRATKARIRAGLAAAWGRAAAALPDRLLAARDLRARRSAAEAELARLRGRLAALDGEARELVARHTGAAAAPVPLALWTFDDDGRDALGPLHAELLDGAVVRDGRLLLDGLAASARTAPLAADIGAKTLEAWVALANLEQRGGGVVAIDTTVGNFFDAIVFGEIEPGRWLAGSDFFNRTEPPGGAAETEPGRLIHIAITWAADGTVTLFRDGEPHGRPYAKAPTRTFLAGEARVLFGQRLSGINPPLAGAIEEARLHAQALDPEAIAASFRAGPGAIIPSDDTLVETLGPEGGSIVERRRVVRAEAATLAAGIAALQADDRPLAEALAAAAAEPLDPLHALAADPTAGGDEGVVRAWHATRTAVAAARRAAAAGGAAAPSGLDLSGPDAAAWTRHGPGFDAERSAPGEFVVETDGEAILRGLPPVGFHSHLLGSRRHGVLHSPRFVIGTDSIFLNVLGRSAVARIVIENYPLGNGGIFPAVRPDRDAPGWIRLDTAYRRGATGYVELATEGTDRAAAGIVAVAVGDGTTPPGADAIAAAPLVADAAPRSAAAHAAAHGSALAAAVARWEAGTLDEDGRALLDAHLRRGLLPATLGELGELRADVERYRALERDMAVPRRAPGMLEGPPFDQPLLVRGQHTRPAAPVPRRGLSLHSTAPFRAGRDPSLPATSGRLELAEEFVGPARPLVARVMVNRLWHHVFGRGIVATADDFGHTGSPPSHPEILDLIAAEFIADAWSVKRLVRRLVTTRAFRGAAAESPEARASDPDNRLLSHARLRRLEAEAMRDAILAVSGELDPSMGGPGVDLHATGKTEGAGPTGPLDGARRRSLYLRSRRNSFDPLLEVFDLPKPSTTRGVRDATTSPTQALALLNAPFVLDQAAKWGARVAAEEGDDAAKVRRMLRRALSREPDDTELEALVAARVAAAAAGAPADGYADVAHAIFCLGEFFHVE